MGYLLALLAVLYPLLAYFGLSYGSPSLVAMVLIVVLLARYKFSTVSIIRPGHLKVLTIAMVLLLGYSLLSDSSLGIRLYPVVTSLLFGVFFSASLWAEQTVIERIARLREPNLPVSAVCYTRQVTRIWVVFFFINAIISAYTALYTELATWTLYNGLISYCLIGILVGGEWLLRSRFKYRKRHKGVLR